MHTIIADIGSTKADWIWIDETGQQHTASTFGFNPFNSDGEAFINAAQRALQDWPLQAKELTLHCYGTGCKTEVNKKKTHQLMRMLCPNTSKIEILSDIVGACHACCGHSPGIVAILGTGLNSCLYDGTKITDRMPSLGYLAGDPGSGYDLGRRILQAYAWREMPPEICQAIEKKYPGGSDQIIKELYQEVQPNVFLASFTPYLTEYRNTPFVQRLLAKAFDEFVLSNLAKYKNPQKWPVSFVGSIAYVFRDELKKSLEKNGLELGVVIKQPSQALTQYILKNQGTQNG